MNVLDLFSGIGGFSLGLERAGMQTVAFCEIDPYCQAVLRKHWPATPICGDIVGGDFTWVNADVICGGFPCQDISVAGKGAGIEGERSGLWSEFARIIGEVRPRYVIVENVAALLGRGIERVLGDLAALGYNAEWHCISASAVGAPHRRDRVWIVGHANAERCRWRANNERQTSPERNGTTAASDVADARGNEAARYRPIIGEVGQFDWWLAEPNVGRVAHGVSFRVDRLKSLGNAIVPQIAEIIGKAIMRHE